MKVWFRKLRLYTKLFLSTFKKRNKDEYGNDIYPH